MDHDLTMVSRPRLLERAAEVLRTRLTLMVAPPGSGKSVLLQQWATYVGSSADVVVVTLTTQDNAPEHFRLRIGSAVATVAPALGWDTLTVPVPSDLEEFITAVTTRPTADRPFVLVLDNVDLVIDTEVISVFAAAIAMFPESMRIVFASRRTPDLPLAELRARHELHEVTLSDLAFTTEEVDALAVRRGRPVSTAELGAIQADTGGWPCGVDLLLGTVHDDDPARRRALRDYLDEVMLADLPADLLRFTEDTAVLSGPTAAWADELLGTDDAAECFRRIDRLGRFPVAVPGREGRWQPPVVREHVLSRLRVRDADRFTALRQAATTLEADAVGLSPREQEILGLLERGLTTAQVARECATTFLDAREQVTGIYRKLRATDGPAALQRARELGLLGS